MSVVTLTRPDGKPIAINAAQWHTITEDMSGREGRHTQVGFSGTGSAIYVKESYDDVVKQFAEAKEKD